MDNKTTAKHIGSSIKKWREIRRLVRRNKRKDRWYIGAYWNPCGYCAVYKSNCDACLLCRSHSRKYGMPYCYTYRSEPSVASRALRLADNGHWAEALQHVDCLLAKMGRDLRKAGSKC